VVFLFYSVHHNIHRQRGYVQLSTGRANGARL
jgi:hypothetical protein